MIKKDLIDLIHFSIIPKDDPKQALRIRRLFLASATYILCFSIAYISYLTGVTEWEVIIGYLIIMPSINIILYIVHRTGLNLKMTDPSLTSVQMCAGILVITYGIYFSSESRGVLLLTYIIVFLFGVFRLNTRSFLYISVFTLLAYGINIALLRIYRPQGVNFNIEYLQWGVLALVLAAFSVIGGYISSLRRNLNISRATIQEMAIRDELTGLYNRRHVRELLEHEKNRSLRGSDIFCLAMLDIDCFKNVNDTYGHHAGDLVLKAVAATIKNTMRNTEFCGRYGGEEFLIILTQTDLKGALIGAERVRTNIENTLFPDVGPDFKITISIGLSEYKMEEDIDDVIARADEALYQAKNGGRNRVEFA
ncbi:MAG: GGDEF domain-containing protein [Smithellaceae bacterium]